MNKVFILLFSFITSSCFNSKPPVEPHVVQVASVPADFLIPQELIKIVESDLAIESKILAPVFMFTKIEIMFSEKTTQTLSSPAILFKFPKGGGEIDLQTVVNSQGSFHMSFPPGQFKDLPPLEHLYYISQAPKKKIQDEEFGLGCARWVDLANKFPSMQKEKFVTLNTTDNRHLYTLAGTYVFVFRKINQIYLAHISLTDSKHKAQLCPPLKAASL